MSARVLIVDDDPRYARALARALTQAGLEVSHRASAAEARRDFLGLQPDVAVLDVRFPDGDGLVLMDALKAQASPAVFVVLTAYPDLDQAVSAMRNGAFDYVAKDRALDECVARVERAAEVAQLRRRVAASRGSDTPAGRLLGESAAMLRLVSRLEALACSDDTTGFIVGETGTGKGVIARRIHEKSGRALEPFVPVDCTTIPATLVESELFGHERGAFSGAVQAKVGRVEAAAGGTLFLDEIGELELPMQAKLLRLLEEREFTRVGGTKARRLAARVLTATNRDLGRAVAAGRFRADLRYRLEVFVVEVPPLRERDDDIFLLAAHFARECARTLGRTPPRFDDAVLAAMDDYPFPGNVRELRNMVEQAVLLARDDVLRLEEFPVLSRVSQGWELPAQAQQTMHPSPLSPAAVHPSPLSPAAVHPSPLSPAAVHPSPLSPAAVHPSPLSPAALAPAALVPQPPLGRPATPAPDPTSVPANPVPGSLSTPRPVDVAMPDLDAIRRAHADAEKVELLRALASTGGNVSAAARALGLSRYQVLRRLSKYGLR